MNEECNYCTEIVKEMNKNLPDANKGTVVDLAVIEALGKSYQCDLDGTKCITLAKIARKHYGPNNSKEET